MSASELMTAVVECVADRLVNVGNQPPVDRILRYLVDPLPNDCCTKNGTLVCSWADGRAGDVFPQSASQAQAMPCAQFPTYTLTLRFVTCWPVPEVNADGVVVSAVQDAEYDAASAKLTDIADVGIRTLLELQCAADKPPAASAGDEHVHAVVTQLARVGSLRFLDAAPILPRGGCAGVRWRLNVSPTGAA